MLPFAITLEPTTASPPDAELRALAHHIVEAHAGAPDAAGWMRTSDGALFRLAGRELTFTRTSPQLCTLIFEAALRTNAYVMAAEGAYFTPVVVKGASGETPGKWGRPQTASTPKALCNRLDLLQADWDRSIRQAQKAGILGLDLQPVEPPSDPGSEPRLDLDPTGIAARCDDIGERFVANQPWKIIHKVVTRNPQVGVVWRADIEHEDGYISRQTCWMRPGRKGLMTSNRPLEMFDPTKTLGPLRP